ncbi:putative arabinose efflux permease, MFS family [Prauserella aidingensis]|uniref:MFS transporter n=1 Tax=Prauserella aidingensis TaxID=387890 RepID=UPI0020A248E9|nr:MFS transporter [Prauserella aidingensis]MCP2253687.1 putative arabinose efflux permease, MFS family [Prauserella aidingensis]
MRKVIHDLAIVRRNPVFRRFWLGMLISRAGDAFTTVALSWLVLTVAGPAQLGVVLLCFGLPRIFSAPVAGQLLDRFQPRLLLGWDNALRGALVALLPLLAAVELLSVPVICVIAAFCATLSAVTEVAEGALVPRLVDDADLESANALLGANWELAYIVGPPVSGLIVAWAGASPALIVDALSFGLMSLICFGLPRLGKTSAEQPAGFLKKWLGAGALFRLPAVLTLTLTTLVFLFLSGMIEVFYPVFSRDGLQAGSGAYGLLVGVAGCGALLGVVVGPALLRTRRPAVKIALAVGSGAPFFGLLALTDNVAVAIALVGVAAFLWGPYFVVERSLVQRLVPEDLRGQVMGARTAVTSLGFPLGSAAGGAVLAGVSVKAVILAMTLAYVALALVPVLSGAVRKAASVRQAVHTSAASR